MKGPGVRLDLDLRRLWTCPQCGQSRRQHAWVTAVRCTAAGCDRESAPTWLKLVADRPPLRKFPTPEKICIPEPIEPDPVEPEPVKPVSIEPAVAEPVVPQERLETVATASEPAQLMAVAPAAKATPVTAAPVELVTPPPPAKQPKMAPTKAAPATDPLDDWPDFGDPE